MSEDLVPSAARGTDPVPMAALETRIRGAVEALLGYQQPDGHLVFELEADVTIASEYVLLVHFLGEIADLRLERKIGNYLRRMQEEHGGWPLFRDGDLDISASVKAYYALKMIGDDPESAHMRRAREAILSRGGASRVNVFTRIQLALYGQAPWSAVPVIPPEIMLLPRWSPFTIWKISYWARTTLVPLLVLQRLRPLARNPRGVRIEELFREPISKVGPPKKAPHQKWSWFLLFRGIDKVLRVGEPLIPKRIRERAIAAAVAFCEERLNGEDGVGAIYPPMANVVMMYDALGRPPDDPVRAVARRAIDRLLVVGKEEAYCQPCVSPIWDTALACHALLEADGDKAIAAARDGLDWLKPRQVLDFSGDWAMERPSVRAGGWAFQYVNDFYPDLDDTAVVAMALDRSRRQRPDPQAEAAITRAREWVVGLQSRNGGFAAFDADNTYGYLNNIPFADHGALLDPPTEDVTARCVSFLAQLGEVPSSSEPLRRGLMFLRRTQRPDGSWYGRWGMNYIYGTWSVLCALNSAGLEPDDPAISKAAGWFIDVQNSDGGWGEDGSSYKLGHGGWESAPSTASQTAWALLGLMAAGAVDHPAVERGVSYLLRNQAAHGLWDEDHHTATGFPRVLYLRYHGYRKYFPLWAMARYRNLKHANDTRAAFGM